MEARLISDWVADHWRLLITVMWVCFVLWLLAGCATTPGGTFCVGKPHRFTDATVNVMTDAEVAQELAHNKQGAALCGWKP